MPEDHANLRKQHFVDNWLTWAALHHFLAAPLVRELAYVIVDQMSKGQLSLEQLFDEAVTNGPACFDSWVIRPREPNSRFAVYLQLRIRAFAWRSDPGSLSAADLKGPPDAISPSTLDKAVELGSADFTFPERVLNDIEISVQPSFTNFVRAFKIARASLTSSSKDDFILALENQILSIGMPLAAVVLKHLGDLCADADAWDKAQALYERASRRLMENTDSCWDELKSSLQAIITQSCAAAMRTLAGPREAANLLARSFSQSTMQDDPLLFGNASFDAWVTATQESLDLLDLPPDRRATVLLPPLLHGAHNVSGALVSWLAAHFHDAHRRFWAVLRRQIALGSLTESRITKALYARSILDEVDQTSVRQIAPQFFQMAIRLLIESGNMDIASKIQWSDKLVDIYVDQECVDFVLAHAQVHKGSQLERQMVAVELFKAWAERIPLDRPDVANGMLKYIADLARESSSFFGSRDVAGQSLKALKYLAQKRPELRKGIASEVAALVSEKLRAPGFWRGSAEALETALEYVDVFSKESLQGVVESIFLLLEETRLETDLWPIVRPALNLLVASPIKCFAGQAPELGRRIVATILRFGLKQESEHANVLFYLHNFDQSLLRDSSVRDTLRDTVLHVRKRATTINSSNVVQNIQALLLAPAVSGIDGVKDALDGLTLILRSATGKQPSIALPLAYDPVLLLAKFQQQIASDISVDLDTFRSWLQPLVALITKFWGVAKDRPLLFATFSFPPATRPDPVIIHNWAFASVLFAKSLGNDDEQLKASMAAAATHPVLRNAIALARATRLAGGEVGSLDIDAIRTENRDAFYSALGRRIVVLQRLDDEEARELCKALLDQCIRLGPSAIDAAVFLSAVDLKVGGYVTQASFSDYMKRLASSRDLRLALAPILEMFSDKGTLD